MLGAIAGHFIFQWLADQGFYGMIIPGGLVGVAAGLITHRSRVTAIICLAIALVAGVLTEFHYAPFIADASLGYFLRHLLDLRGLTLVMIAAGAAIAYWGLARSRTAN